MKSLDVRRSISEILAAMDEQHKARWFVLNEIEAGPGLDAAIEAALDDGVDAEDVLSSLVEAMMELGEDELEAQAKKGPGRGWWGPDKGGTHGKGSQGKGSGLYVGFSEQQETELQEAIQGIPERHLEGLEEISGEPSKWLAGQKGEWVNPQGGITPSGEYEPGKIRINPNRFSPDTLIHEMGHHVSRNVSDDTVRKVQGAIRSHLMPYYNNEILGRAGPVLADLGLRPYSIGNPLELLADAYHLWHKGTDKQWNAFTSVMKDGADLDFDAMFDYGRGLD